MVTNDQVQDDNDDNLLNTQDLAQTNLDEDLENEVLKDSNIANAKDTEPKQNGHIRHYSLLKIQYKHVMA